MARAPDAYARWAIDCIDNVFTKVHVHKIETERGGAATATGGSGRGSPRRSGWTVGDWRAVAAVAAAAPRRPRKERGQLRVRTMISIIKPAPLEVLWKVPKAARRAKLS